MKHDPDRKQHRLFRPTFAVQETQAPAGRLTSGEVVDAIDICRAQLRESGMDLAQMTDHDEILEEIAMLGKPYHTASLSPDHNDFHSFNSFFLKIVDYGTDAITEGSTIGVAGLRMDSVPPGEFPRFFGAHLQRLYSDPSGRRVLTTQVFPPEIYQMQGNIAYAGDFYIAPDRRGRSFNKGAFVLLLYLYAWLEWRFNWLYLFIRDQHAKKGYFSRYYMPVTYPASVLWASPPEERCDTDNLGVLSEQSFVWIVRRLLSRPDLFCV